MQISTIELIASTCFALALIHTFSVHKFQQLAARFPEGSTGENFFHLLGEVEVVFGLWAAIFLGLNVLLEGSDATLSYMKSLNFTEPGFVFVILSVCSTRPILFVASWLIERLSLLVPLKKPLAFYCTALVAGPLLGSLITEPAAMTLTALILLDRFYTRGISNRLAYATLGLLFVNISIGGTLTNFAAPPVLMVAPVWGWDTTFMLQNFGWRGALACVLSTAATAFAFRREISGVEWTETKDTGMALPFWVIGLHLLFLLAIVVSSHHMVVFGGIFLFFMGLVQVTKEYQRELKLREGLLVAFFLGGLVVLGGPQRWWLEPILTSLSTNMLFWGAAGLTAFTDNAALTYLGAQVPGLSDASKIALVSGAVVGGGLTVVANAPNPAGYGILNSAFKDGGISPLYLLLGALFPTFIAALCYWAI